MVACVVDLLGESALETLVASNLLLLPGQAGGFIESNHPDVRVGKEVLRRVSKQEDRGRAGLFVPVNQVSCL